MIAEIMRKWEQQNEFHALSCHDTNLIAVMSLLGIKIIPPDFAGYILLERTIDNGIDTVAVYYCPTPFLCEAKFGPKIWPPLAQRSNFVDWDNLSPGTFMTTEFLNLFHAEHLS